MSIKGQGARKRLIMMVKERRQLWDPKDPRYKDPKDTPRTWMDIGNLCGNTPEKCQRTWKYLRDCYQAKRKKLPIGSEYGKEPWAYMDIMKFIDDVSKPRPQPVVNMDSILLGKLESSAMESNSLQEIDFETHGNIETVDDDMPGLYGGHSNAGSITPTQLEDPLGVTDINKTQERLNRDSSEIKVEKPRQNFRKAILNEMRKGKDPDFHWLSSLHPLLKKFKDGLKKERVKIKIHSFLVDSLEEQDNDFLRGC